MTSSTLPDASPVIVRAPARAVSARSIRPPQDPGPGVTPGRALWMYIRQHGRWLVPGAVLTAAGSFVSTLPPVFIGQIVDDLNQPELAVIAQLALAMVVLTVGQALFQAVGRYLLMVTARDVEYEMRDDLFHHLQRLDLAYFQHHRIGDLMARMTNDLNAVRMMLSMG